MIKAILLDLDNTLLNNVDEVFVPQYLNLADQYFASQWQHSDMAATLRRVIGALSTPRDVRQTNTAVAEAIVAGAAQRSAEDVQAAFGDFYRTVYPSLRRCVEPIPLAAELVRYLRKLDCALVIATNPLYPAEAIYQRLEWAGLSSDPADYAFVTTSDNTHFIKPDPAYFAEIIARVGVEPDETLMLGDSLSSDIEPAACLGINTYHLTPSAQGDHAGTLADFYHLITATDWLQRTRPTQLKPEAIHPQLRGNLGALFGLLSEVKDQQWEQYPDPEEWSILEVVCHLLYSEVNVQRPRLERILAEDNPFLIPPPTPPRPREVPRCAVDGMQAAEAFCTERLKTIAWLDQLPPDAWKRPARHSIFGLTTLLEMAHFTAQHDRLHINQICATLGRCQE